MRVALGTRAWIETKGNAMMPGGWEWVLIIIVVVFFFGARRIPEMFRSVGQGIRAFKDEMSSDPKKRDQADPRDDAPQKKA